MSHKQIVRAGVLCCIAALSGLSLAGWLPAAQASTHEVGYSITLTADGATSITYGASTSSFHADFKHPTTKPANANTVTLFVDNGTSYGGSESFISNTESQFYFGGVADLTPGTHTLQARYYLTTTATWIVSNTITITVGKGYANESCGITNLLYTYAAGQPLKVDVSVNATSGNVAVDWQHSTFTLVFTGPATLNYPNLKADTNQQVTVSSPKVAGHYLLTCTFNGSAFFNPATSGQVPVLVSQGHQTGAVRVYTNPTTVRANASNTWYVVIPAAPGLPTPTGSFDIRVGNGTTRPIDLSPAGDATVQLTAPTSVYGQIQIIYFGDTVYASETPSFPLTNPPIPGAGSGTATPGPTPTAAGTTTVGTPAPTVTGGTTGTPAATPAATPVVAAASTQTNGPTGLSAMPVIMGTLGLLAIAGGGMLLWRRRAGTVVAPPAEHVWRQEPMMEDTAKLPTPRADWGD